MTGATKHANRSLAWSDPAFPATEFLFAEYRNFVFPRHVHESFAIGVIEFGGQRFRSGRSPSLVMPAGTLCAINPGVVHEGEPATPDGWHYRMFYPNHLLVADLFRDTRPPRSGDWGIGRHVIYDAELYREFVALHVSSQLGEPLLQRETLVMNFLRRLFERHGNRLPNADRARRCPRTAAIVRDYLHSRSHQPVAINDLARAAQVSPTQVIRAFSAETGMPPHAYLISLRVERAKALLRRGIGPARTALDVGFADQSQLTRHFKRLTGLTPGCFAAGPSSQR
ncbi:AraC family transcriptional regulator [Bradyrhizobium sp. USDA 4473]